MNVDHKLVLHCAIVPIIDQYFTSYITYFQEFLIDKILHKSSILLSENQ